MWCFCSGSFSTSFFLFFLSFSLPHNHFKVFLLLFFPASFLSPLYCIHFISLTSLRLANFFAFFLPSIASISNCQQFFLALFLHSNLLANLRKDNLKFLRCFSRFLVSSSSFSSLFFTLLNRRTSRIHTHTHQTAQHTTQPSKHIRIL